MPVVYNNQVPAQSMYPKVERKELIGRTMGAASISIGEITIYPGGEIPLHRHKVEDCVLLREGKGEIHMNDEIVKVAAPMSILIPAGVRHRVLNTGTEPIKIIYAFPAIEVERELL
jgi:quercetin dioxygenase-like cupin family protein